MGAKLTMEAFRVQNYRSVEDSGWVTVTDLCALVGKNESGKTALLRALSKLKPADGERFNGQREFPRHRYTREFERED